MNDEDPKTDSKYKSYLRDFEREATDRFVCDSGDSKRIAHIAAGETELFLKT